MGRGKRPGRARCVRERFWAAIREGMLVPAASAAAGVSQTTGNLWFTQAGGVISNGTAPVSGRQLCFAEREDIALLRVQGLSQSEIAVRLGRHKSTISRELRRNATQAGYRASVAEDRAQARAKRPKTAKLAGDQRLREVVQNGLTARWSPRQISVRLARDFPDEPEMRVSHETIYQSIYVQGRGALRRELAVCLRTGRALRKPRAQTRAQAAERGPIRDKIMISERPPEAEDRAIPGHWEGDLILGKEGRSAIGTLVERTTRFCILLHLPGRHDAEAVRDQMIAVMGRLPEAWKRSLTWDQGSEMARHREISVATGLDIYFCDPHSPWQRGSNENTNGLLRQYFPKGTDLSAHTAEHLALVAAELNGRPRQTLGWDTPFEALETLLFPPDQPTQVATTS
jgi:IS30 family transposase